MSSIRLNYMKLLRFGHFFIKWQFHIISPSIFSYILHNYKTQKSNIWLLCRFEKRHAKQKMTILYNLIFIKYGKLAESRRTQEKLIFNFQLMFRCTWSKTYLIHINSHKISQKTWVKNERPFPLLLVLTISVFLSLVQSTILDTNRRRNFSLWEILQWYCLHNNFSSNMLA